MTGYDDISDLLADLLFVLNFVYFCDNVMMYFLFPVFFSWLTVGVFIIIYFAHQNTSTN